MDSTHIFYYSGQLTRMVRQSGLIPGHFPGFPKPGYATGYNNDREYIDN